MFNIPILTSSGQTFDFEICEDDVYIDPGNPCLESLIATAELDAAALYEEYLDTEYDLFVKNYKETCALVSDEDFNVEYDAVRFHYTLLYYDLSGNLVKTVPPLGVNPLNATEVTTAKNFADGTGSAIYPAHTFKTIYNHNSLNQVTNVTTPDGGTSEFWYDEIGRLVVSQDAKQADFYRDLITGDYSETGTQTPAYSYTKYDELGRVTEVGEIIQPTAMSSTISKDASSLASWMNTTTASSLDIYRNNVTYIYYDNAVTTEAEDEFGYYGYGETRNRITGVEVVEDYFTHTASVWVIPDADYRNHYQYDIHGNVKSYLQEIVALDTYGQPFRRVDYEYDLISGNPNYIWYQKGEIDQYVHHYRYDADNRLAEVYTSSDGIIWDRDADYEYREDGYLARTELGEMKVQGCDYAYTLHGWLKMVNSGVLDEDYDMGKDGAISPSAEYSTGEDDIHGLVARDVHGYTIGYYENDYNAINTGTGYNNVMVNTSASAFNTDIDELFNGNITSVISGMTDETGSKVDPSATTYHYDQLHRFKESHVFTATNIISTNSLSTAARQNTTSVTIDGSATTLGDYEVHVNYDANGNITELARMSFDNGGTHNNSMDNFSYSYSGTDNKLKDVTDAVTSTSGLGFDDIQNGQTTDNYTYYDDGSLKSDLQEEIDYIDWYPNGKIKQIYRTSASTQPDLYFEYDPMGIRVLKVTMSKASAGVLDDEEDWGYTYYATDANGITHAIYELDLIDGSDDELSKKESMIYGGSRLGMDVELEQVNVAYDPENDCNEGGLASAVILIGSPLPAGDPNITVAVGGTSLFSTTVEFTSDYAATANNLKAAIEAENPGLEVTVHNYTGLYLVEITETEIGALYGEMVFSLDAVDNTSTYVTRQPSAGECYTYRELGNKMYELTNHLGNVMNVISDRKVAHDNSGTIDYFEADVVSYSDYYPFGMEMPNRNGRLSGGDYRYAFNGMETDKEVSGSGNSYTTQFRQYDPRLGRWKSLDPLMAKYLGQSGFSAFNNNPVFFNDPKGLEGEDPLGSETNPETASSSEDEQKILQNRADRGNTDDVFINSSGVIIKFVYNKETGNWVGTELGTGDPMGAYNVPVKEGSDISSANNNTSKDLKNDVENIANTTSGNNLEATNEPENIEVMTDGSNGVYVTGVGTWLDGDAKVRSQYKAAWAQVEVLYKKGLVDDATASMIRYQLQKVSKLKLSPIGSIISEVPPFGKSTSAQYQKAMEYYLDRDKKLSSGAFNTRSSTNIASKIGKAAGPVLVFVGLYMSVDNIITSEKPMETTVVEVGSWAGAYVGAAAGFAAFGPIGGIIGGILGGWLGEGAMKAWMEQMSDPDYRGLVWVY